PRRRESAPKRRAVSALTGWGGTPAAYPARHAATPSLAACGAPSFEAAYAGGRPGRPDLGASSDRCVTHDFEQRRDDLRVELAPRVLAQLRDGDLLGQRRAVRTIGNHRVVRV